MAAGTVLRSQGSSGEDGLWRCRAGDEVIASNACSGPFPLLNGRRWDGAFSRREAWDWGCLEMTEAELSNLMQHDPIERPRSKTTSSV